MNVFFNNKSFIVDESESIKNFLEANYAVGDSSTRFLVDGERLVVDDVSFSQIMDESSRIDVVREMVGGAADENGPADEPMALKVTDQTGDEMIFRVKKGAKVAKIFSAYAERKGLELADLRFTCDGVRINNDDTPKMLELEDGDQIDSLVKQEGGTVDDGDAVTADEPITLKVRDPTGDEMVFKVKKSTKMAKIFSAYAQRKGVDVQTIRFNVDGQNISETDTPKMLELEDGGEINSAMQQVGGSEDGPADEPITLKVRDQTGDEMMFKVKKGTKMAKIFSAYAQRKGVELANLRFTCDGTRINNDDTPKMLELEDGDQIDSLIEQVGGRASVGL